jgi:hypothetical protein
MKLASARLVEQLLPQFLPGCDHEGEGLGSPFLDTRLHSMRSTGVDDQGFSWDPGARCAEPSQRIHKADLLHADVLKGG